METAFIFQRNGDSCLIAIDARRNRGRRRRKNARKHSAAIVRKLSMSSVHVTDDGLLRHRPPNGCHRCHLFRQRGTLACGLPDAPRIPSLGLIRWLQLHESTTKMGISYRSLLPETPAGDSIDRFQTRTDIRNNGRVWIRYRCRDVLLPGARSRNGCRLYRHNLREK